LHSPHGIAHNSYIVSNQAVTNVTLRVLGIGMMLAAGSLPGQTPSFDVASIKPSETITPAMIQAGKLHVGMKIDGARVDITGPAWTSGISG
jgi:hypothetical protein